MRHHLTLVGLVLFGTFVTTIPVALAHSLKSDGTIGAVLHIDPEDNPVAGSSSAIYFDLKSKEPNFALSSCNCQVRISQAGKTLTSVAVSAAGLQTGSFSFVFPQRDVYQMELTGQPLQGAAFRPFALSWDIRVDKDVATQRSDSTTGSFISTHTPQLIILGVVIALSYVISTLVGKRPHS